MQPPLLWQSQFRLTPSVRVLDIYSNYRTDRQNRIYYIFYTEDVVKKAYISRLMYNRNDTRKVDGSGAIAALLPAVIWPLAGPGLAAPSSRSLGARKPPASVFSVALRYRSLFIFNIGGEGGGAGENTTMQIVGG